MNLSTTFDHQSYLNIETYRKNGLGVKTPVWFVQDGGTFFVRTDATSGKVKRIRNHPQVHIAPCITYLRLGIGRTAVASGEKWAVHLPFSITLGWITVATVANISDVLDFIKMYL